MVLPTWNRTVASIMLAIVEIIHAWITKLFSLMRTQSDEDVLTRRLLAATTYNEWWRAAVELDNLPARYDWRHNPLDGRYDYRHLEEHRKELNRLRLADEPVDLSEQFRLGLVRNMFKIAKPALYKQTYTTTKESIQAYIEESVKVVRYLAESSTATTMEGGRFTRQAKLEMLHDARATFGHTALLLQGGSIFGLCHLGVVKALMEHRILPKVIVGTATGALMAALIGIHTDGELPAFLCGDNLDLSAFAESSRRAREKMLTEHIDIANDPEPKSRFHNWCNTLARRVWRLIEQGFLLDPVVLSECIKANVGDLTFDEAYKLTGRILNIIVSPPSEEVPALMNYLSAPNVLIRSAAMASHITNMAQHRDSPIQLLYKDSDGHVRTLNVQPFRRSTKTRRATTSLPLTRLIQQFNIDHFIISQARPYIAPFLQPTLPYIRKPPPRLRLFSFALPLLSPLDLLLHTLRQLDRFDLLPEGLRRLLSDETVKGDAVTLVPEVQMRDWRRLLKNPRREEVDFWIMRGERAVWPSLCALKVRCFVEVALDEAYERVRDRKTGLGHLGRHGAFMPPVGVGGQRVHAEERTLLGEEGDDSS